MKNLTVPIVPLSKEDQIAKQILKSSAKAPDIRNVIDFDEDGSTENMKLVLLGIGMEKYNDLFIKNNVDLKTFFQLDEWDLREIGITDAKDLETIRNNLLHFEKRQKKYSVKNNPLQDLQIARNVKNELILLQNYCIYLELQLRRQKLTDYRINWKESATKYLKAFAETAVLEAKFLSQRVYCDSGDEHLIGKILKLNTLTLPDHLKEKLIKDKPKRRQKAVCITVIFAILSMAVALKYLL